MAKFLDYNPEQMYLLPPSVKDVLGPDHLCFLIRRIVAKLNLEIFRSEYGEEGGPAYAPEMLVSVWLYAYALGMTSSRRLEQRLREDLAFRYLVAGATPDHWTLNHFRRRQARALNDVFTQVVEWARKAKLGRLRQRASDPAHRGMRRKLRDPAGRRIYQRRKAIVQPVFGVLKEPRGMLQFARRGLPQVAVELALAATAYNLTRIWRAS